MSSSMNKNTLKTVLRSDFNAFIMKTFQTIDNSQKFIPAQYIELIADKLIQCMSGKIKRLIINIPPRGLKSTIVSVAFPAYLLGMNPSERILCISYSDDLASKFSRDCRKVLESNWYKEIFRHTRLNPNKKSESEFETTKNGYRLAVSMGGSLTGRGGNWIILDDPQKPDDMLSETKRNTSNQLFDNTIFSRLNNKEDGVFILVTQRLHLDDLTAYVQKYGNWEILSIPAIAEKDEEYILNNGKIINRKKGEVLNKELESFDTLMEMKNAMGNYNFLTQYQQQPIPEKGNIIDYDKFLFYESLPNEKSYEIVQSWDIAVTDNKTSDYCVCITAMVIKEVYYIISIYKEKLRFPELLKQVKELKTIHKATRIIIEESTIGIALVDQLKKNDIHTIKYKPEGSKAERASIQTSAIESGRVFLPKNASWLDDFKSEVISFPCGKHDDQVDALTQLLAAKYPKSYRGLDLQLNNSYCESPFFDKWESDFDY